MAAKFAMRAQTNVTRITPELNVRGQANDLERVGRSAKVCALAPEEITALVEFFPIAGALGGTREASALTPYDSHASVEDKDEPPRE